MMQLSVVIPAYNEELYLPETLTRVTKALAVAGWPSEIVVVDNDSHDRTRAISESFGARVVSEQEHNISRVRNTGATHATGDVLIFIDADTHWFLSRYSKGSPARWTMKNALVEQWLLIGENLSGHG